MRLESYYWAWWWPTPVIPALRMWTQEDREFQHGLHIKKKKGKEIMTKKYRVIWMYVLKFNLLITKLSKL
jgi:hypothetical protein